MGNQSEDVSALDPGSLGQNGWMALSPHPPHLVAAWAWFVQQMAASAHAQTFLPARLARWVPSFQSGQGSDLPPGRWIDLGGI